MQFINGACLNSEGLKFKHSVCEGSGMSGATVALTNMYFRVTHLINSTSFYPFARTVVECFQRPFRVDESSKHKFCLISVFFVVAFVKFVSLDPVRGNRRFQVSPHLQANPGVFARSIVTHILCLKYREEKVLLHCTFVSVC